MKKTILIFIIYSLLCGMAFAEDLFVILPELEVILGSETRDKEENQYPVFSYNGMTYFPLTLELATIVDLDLSLNVKSHFNISKTTTHIFEQRFLAQMNHKDYYGDKLKPFPVVTEYDNQDNQMDFYPFILHNDVVYLPMSWQYAHDTFGLNDIISNEDGLVINGSKETTNLRPKRLMLSVGEDYKEVGITFNMASNEPIELLLYNEVFELLEEQTLISNHQIVFDKTYNVYKTTIGDLQTGQQYYYRIRSLTEQSKLHGFKTVNNETTMAFFGDIQGYKLDQYIDFYDIYLKAQEHDDIDLTYLAGDIVDNDIKEWSYFDQAMHGIFSNNLLVTAIGNHDVKTSSYIYEQSFNYPQNGVNDLFGRNFYFDLPNARIAVWDTETFDQYDDQSKWLKETMSETEKFKIVLMHRSVYPMLYDEPIVRRLNETFETADIDLVLSGHDHIYNRTTMYQNKKVKPNEGVTYIVGGSGSGSKFYEEEGNRYWKHIVYDENNPVYTSVNITSNAINIFAYAVKNDKLKLIDELIISK